MKRLIILPVMLVLAFAVNAAAQNANVTFAWDHDGTGLAGFELEVLRTGQPTQVIDIGAANRNHALPLVAGSYTAKMRAYALGIPASVKVYSGYSNEIAFTIPVAPPSPTGLTITITVTITSP